MERITEMASPYRHLESMPMEELLASINAEDQKVALAVQEALPQIAPLVTAIAARLREGGRLFYIGAGASGRLGILDASECPPTYGVPENLVIGLIAGGDVAIRRPVEDAEDDEGQAWEDLSAHFADEQDAVVGITASGTTPYVVAGLKACRQRGILTGCITCNPGSAAAAASDYPIEVITGPEFVTGSTRMKAGTAQKMVLNMISTGAMIGLGRVQDNRMVDMQLTNHKLRERGAHMLMQALGVDHATAEALLLAHGNVRQAISNYSPRQSKTL
jgi:N-acetylmuramic acid 6-phosphate etherase